MTKGSASQSLAFVARPWNSGAALCASMAASSLYYSSKALDQYYGIGMGRVCCTHLFEHDECVLVVQLLVDSICQAAILLVVSCVLDDQEL